MSNKVKPVLRYVGSKYQKLDLIFQTFNFKLGKEVIFLDMFGGSGIVGVNVKALFGGWVTINDYDNVLPVTKENAIINNITWDGNCKKITIGATKQFVTKLKNCYWEKFEKYNEVIKQCKIISKDYNEVGLILYNYVFVDPPYDDIKGIYKKSFKKEDHISLYKKLNLYKKYRSDYTKILITYNDTPFIRELYKDWNIKEIDYQYHAGAKNKTNTKKKVKELFITNF